MEAGVTSKELENAMKTRLSAVHMQINEIYFRLFDGLYSGNLLTIRGMWTII